jgi:hypothetical protein
MLRLARLAGVANPAVEARRGGRSRPDRRDEAAFGAAPGDTSVRQPKQDLAGHGPALTRRVRRGEVLRGRSGFFGRAGVGPVFGRDFDIRGPERSGRAFGRPGRNRRRRGEGNPFDPRSRSGAGRRWRNRERRGAGKPFDFGSRSGAGRLRANRGRILGARHPGKIPGTWHRGKGSCGEEGRI